MFVLVDSTARVEPHFSTKTRRFRTGERLSGRSLVWLLSQAKNDAYTIETCTSNKTEHAFIQALKCAFAGRKKSLKLSQKVCAQGLTRERQSVIMIGQRWKVNPSDGSERKRKHPDPVTETRGMRPALRCTECVEEKNAKQDDGTTRGTHPDSGRNR